MQDMEDLQKVLHDLADEIRKMDKQITGLEGFMIQIEDAKDCFTHEEVQATQTRIEMEKESRNQKLDTLREKVEVYESKVLDLQARLDTRKKIIENPEGNLESVPELLSVFAEQHASICSELQAAREFLMSR